MFINSSKRISILFLIDALSFGGGERVFAQIANRLPIEKYQLYFASQPNDHLHHTIKKNHVHFFPLDFTRRINPSLIKNLSRIIKYNRIDIIHAQGSRADFYGRLAKKLSGSAKYISTITTLVEGFNVNPLRRSIYSFFNRYSERFVDRFSVVSDSLCRRLIYEHRIAPDAIARIYNGVEMDYYLPDAPGASGYRIRNEFGIDRDSLLIGALGRLVWEKGFEYLIGCIPKVKKVFPNAKVMIVGDGPLRENLQAKGDCLGVSRDLIFTGFRTDAREILSAIDVLAIPSIVEAFPMITLEGMAMAKPIVASRIDGIVEQVIDNVSGLLVPSRNSDALATAIVEIFQDKDRFRMLGLNARRRVAIHFSVEKMVSETEKVYNSLFRSKLHG